jgi:hypothetical protein
MAEIGASGGRDRPLPHSDDWRDRVNRAETATALEALHASARSSEPCGSGNSCNGLASAQSCGAAVAPANEKVRDTLPPRFAQNYFLTFPFSHLARHGIDLAEVEPALDLSALKVTWRD